MTRWIRVLAVLAAIAAMGLPGAGARAERRSYLPVTCQIKLEKEQISAGEQMKVWAWYFQDREHRLPAAASRVVVYALYGDITNGVQLATQPEGYRAFQVGGGAVELDYKAPDVCPDKPEQILVYNSLDNVSPGTQPMNLTTLYHKIGQRGVKLLCPSFLMLTQTMLHRTKRRGSTSLLEIRVKVRLGLEVMGKGAIAIKNSKVVQYSGRDMYVSGATHDDYSLSGASLGSVSGAIQVFRDQDQRISSISIPPMTVMLSWRGGEGLTPPREMVIGPVNKPSHAQNQENKNALRQARNRARGKAPWEMYRLIMPPLSKALAASPDLKLSEGDGLRSASGGGVKTRPEPDGVNRESFAWSLALNER